MLLDGTVIPLIDIWELLTLLPGQAKDYPKQEFTRDVYLLQKAELSIHETEHKSAFLLTGMSLGKY